MDPDADDDASILGALRGPIEIFERLADFVALIDAAGSVVWANPFAIDLLGEQSSDVLGHNMVEFLHPDELIRALRVVGMMTERQLDVPVSPAIFRLRRSDGDYCPVEINASMVPTGDDGHLVLIVGRYSGDRDLQDRILQLLISEVAPESVIDLVPQFGMWRHPADHYSVLFTSDDGSPMVAGSDLVSAMGEERDSDAPWVRAARAGEEVIVAHDDLPDDVRALADAHHLLDCWAVPVPDPLHETPAVIVTWRREASPTIEVHRYAMETMARALALVLRWRQQVTNLRRAARRDPLTGLTNRTGFWEVLEAIGHDWEDRRVAVLYIDLDGFKGVNDAHGHRVGDQVLALTAQRILSVLRPGDLVARLGGDEFGVVCRELPSRADVEAIAGRVVAALEEPFQVDAVRVVISASVGVAVGHTGGISPDELLDAADRALYRAKNDGRGRWHVLNSPAPPEEQ